MNQNQIFLILEKLGDIQSVLSANAQKIENIHDNATKDQKVLDELVKDRTSFKVFCAEQVKINSKLNGRFESHHQWVEQEINNCKDFAAREINLINQKYEEDKKGKKSEEVLIQTAKLSLKEKIWVALISALSSIALAEITYLLK